MYMGPAPQFRNIDEDWLGINYLVMPDQLPDTKNVLTECSSPIQYHNAWFLSF